MSAEEREIIESGQATPDGRVIVPEEGDPKGAKWHNPQYIMRRLTAKRFPTGMKPEDRMALSKNLIETWVTLDSTEPMVEKYLAMIISKFDGDGGMTPGDPTAIEKALAYFYNLAQAVAEVDQPDPFTDSEEPTYIGATASSYRELEKAEENNDWYAKQPLSFKAIMKHMFSLESVDDFREIGQKAYAAPFTKQQKQYFWGWYEHLRKALTARDISSEAQQIIDTIRKVQNLKGFSRILYKTQQGEGGILGVEGLKRWEWDAIWKAHKEEKAKRDTGVSLDSFLSKIIP